MIMYKKYASVLVGAILITTPFIASAQTVSTSPNASLIAALQQLIVILTQELQQLIAARAGSTTGTATITASPASGAAPLMVTFSNVPTTAAEEEFHYGDGQSTSNGFNGSWPNGSLTHVYTAPGTYVASVVGEMSNGQLGTATITVTGNNSTQPSAIIDQSSLTVLAQQPGLKAGTYIQGLTVSGTYSNVSGALKVLIVNGASTLPANSIPNSSVFADGSDHGGGVQMSGINQNSNSGIFADNYVPQLSAGTYTVGVYTYNTIYTGAGYQGDTTPILLASKTVTVQ